MENTYKALANQYPHYHFAAAANGGEHFLIDIVYGPLWNGLMLREKDGYGPLRVVSAWKAFCEGCDTTDGFDRWGEVVREEVMSDLGSAILVGKDYYLFDRYQSFATLFQAYGVDWPLKGLAYRLRTREGLNQDDADELAEKIWKQAVTTYEDYKFNCALQGFMAERGRGYSVSFTRAPSAT